MIYFREKCRMCSDKERLTNMFKGNKTDRKQEEKEKLPNLNCTGKITRKREDAISTGKLTPIKDRKVQWGKQQ